MNLEYIEIKRAVADFLAENGITLKDLLDAMDEDPQSIIESLMARAEIGYREAKSMETKLTASQLNYLIFVLHTFYIVNLGGFYKGLMLLPPRELVIRSNKATPQGLRLLAKALGLPDIW